MKHYVKKIGDNEYRVEEFDSVVELTKANKTREVTSQWDGASLNKGRISKDWHGVESYDQAYEFLQNGWEAGTKKVADLANKVSKTGTRKKTVFTNNIHGFTPNVPLAIMGVPNSMIDIQTINVKSKILTLIYDNTASSGVDTDDMLEAGINVVNTIVNLEMSGYRVNLKVMCSYCNSKSYDICIVNVKDANQPLNLKKIMFPIANSAWLRVIGFDWEDKSPISLYKSSRGTPWYVKNNEGYASVDDFKQLFGQNTFYVNYRMAKGGTDDIKGLITK